MSKMNYHLTSPRNSAERLGLIKIDQLITILTLLLQKLDSDTGVSDINYATLIENLRTMREAIGIEANAFKEEL